LCCSYNDCEKLPYFTLFQVKVTMKQQRAFRGIHAGYLLSSGGYVSVVRKKVFHLLKVEGKDLPKPFRLIIIKKKFFCWCFYVS